MSRKEDPLALGGLNPTAIDEAVANRNVKPGKEPSALDKQKEERLQQREKRLSNPQAAKQDDTAAKLKEERDGYKARSKALDKISAYKERFPWLKSRNKTVGSMEQIQDELHFYELQLAQQGKGNNMSAKVLIAAMGGVEAATQFYNPLNLNLSGLGEVTRQNIDEFQDILDELAIKYGGGAYMPPEYRLVLSLGAMIFTVHSANVNGPSLGVAAARAKATMQRPTDEQGL